MPAAGKAPALPPVPPRHVPRVRGTLCEAGRPAAGAAGGKKARKFAPQARFFADVFRPVKWIGLVFGRHLAVSGQDWAINNDRTLSQTCVFQCYSQIMKEFDFYVS